MKRIITTLAVMAIASQCGLSAKDLTPDQMEQLKLKSAKWMAERMKADQLVKSGKYEQAVDVYKAMIVDRQSLSDDFCSEYDAIGAIYTKWGKTGEALQTYKDMVANREKIYGADDPSVVYPLQQYAAALSKAGKKDEAKSVLARANAINKAVDSKPTFAKITGAPGSPERIAEGAKMRQLGEKFNKLDRQEKAWSYFNQAVLLNPKDALALCERGEAAEFKDQMTAALADLNAAIKMQPDLRQAYVSRAHWHAQKRQNREAIADFDKARSLDSSDAEVMGDRAKLLDEMGEHKAAVEAYTEIIAAHPDLYWTYTQRAVANTSLGQYKPAIEDLTVLVKRSPEDSEFYEQRAKVHFKAGELQNALADYNKVIEFNPKYSIGYHERAKIYEKMDGKKTPRAIADYSMAKKLGYAD